MKRFIIQEFGSGQPISIEIGDDGHIMVLDEDLFAETGAIYTPRIYAAETLDKKPRVTSYDKNCCRLSFVICDRDGSGNIVEISQDEWKRIKISIEHG